MDDRARAPSKSVGPGLVSGIVLLVLGGVLMLLGAIVVGSVAVRVTRRWVRWEQPPREVARQRLDRARSAVTAGSGGRW